ncbi:hypothetical protein FPOA_06432 [Fusarium poae]|uniref:Uncharacterized protein n=1 Tax=Fusarium poae TaxID=36050 RepID=A0A1B8AZI3_FUSPO|nr:hypothetical protein FPOA_06432 [Fusarium poae]
MPNRQPPTLDSIEASSVASPVTLSEQQIRNSCMRDLKEQKNFSPQNLDYILHLLANELPPGFKMMPSNFLDLNVTSILPDKPDKFLAPVRHTESMGHWSLVLVSKEIEDSSNKTYFRALHYDSQPNIKRDKDVESKLSQWVYGHYGKETGLRLGNVIGPKHEQRFASGRFAIMAAIELAKSGTINLKNPQRWDDDPGKLIMDMLNGKRATPHQQPSQSPTPQTPYKTPEAPQRRKSTPLTTSPKKKSPYPLHKNDLFSRATPPAAESPDRNSQQNSISPLRSDRGRSQTPFKNITKRIANGVIGVTSPKRRVIDASEGSKLSIVDTHEPKPKRRRIESSLTLNMSNKDMAAHLSCLQLPDKSSLVKESDKCIAKLHEMEQRLQGREKAFQENAKMYANHKQKLDDAALEHQAAEAQVDKKVQEKNARIEQCRQVVSGFGEDTEANESVANAMKILEASLDKHINSLRINVEEKVTRKRRMSEMVESVDRDQQMLQAAVDTARGQKEEADLEAQRVCRQEDKAAIIEEHVRESRRFLETKLENYDSSQDKCVGDGSWLAAYRARRDQRHKEQGV